MSVSDSVEKSSNNINSSEEGKIWKLGLDEHYNLNIKHSSKQLKKQSKTFYNLDECINANFNCEYLWYLFVDKSKSNYNKNNWFL